MNFSALVLRSYEKNLLMTNLMAVYKKSSLYLLFNDKENSHQGLLEVYSAQGKPADFCKKSFRFFIREN
jgi:hypothetical protein